MTDTNEQTVLTISQAEREVAYDAADALTELIEPAADAVSIFEDGSTWRVDAYYGDTDSGRAALSVLETMFAANALQAALAPVAQENWVALSQSALPPVHAGRFTICGSHDLGRVPNGPNTLIVEAGEAFGTAHHATTYGCLLAIDRLTRVQKFKRVLDLGTGSGVLALAIKRAIPNAAVLATDIDERSIEVAKENAQRNALKRFSDGPIFLSADGLSDGRIQRRAPFNLVVANILAAPLIDMASDVAATLDKGASLVLSGILLEQAGSVVARYRSVGLQLVRHDRHHGWSTLTFQRRVTPGRRAGDDVSIYMPAFD